jgi:hypothetical protein
MNQRPDWPRPVQPSVKKPDPFILAEAGDQRPGPCTF